MTTMILSMIMFIVYVALPIFFLVRIWKNDSADLLKWLISTSSSAGYILCLFFIGGWPMIITGYYMRYALLIALIISVMKSCFNTKRSFSKFTWRYFFTALCTSLASLVPIGITISVLVSSSRIPKAIHIDFPLKNGNYYILHGGNSLFTNHHREVDAQKYALDVIKLNRFGFRSKSVNAQILDDYNIYGDVIYSPCNGLVVEVVDDYSDLEPSIMDPEHPAGNYLTIEMPSSGTTVLLAHVQKGSFLVKKGDSVNKGQPLCRVGNSGNTSEPHLHIHVIKTGGDLLDEGEGVPMKFHNRFLIRNDMVSSFSGVQEGK
ncbi:MAG: M23 family metallopeptidase [Candidatus Rhabdochlamydia sp.]